MSSIAKSAALALAVTATSLLPVTSANAHDVTRHHVHQHNWQGHNHVRLQATPRIIRREHRVHRNNDAIALGVIGLAAGAIIGGAIINGQRGHTYVGPVHRAPGNYYPPAPARGNSHKVSKSRGFEPWSDGWYRYCANKYRSFNASTGTFRGYDGEDHFCVAN